MKNLTLILLFAIVLSCEGQRTIKFRNVPEYVPDTTQDYIIGINDDQWGKFRIQTLDSIFDAWGITLNPADVIQIVRDSGFYHPVTDSLDVIFFNTSYNTIPEYGSIAWNNTDQTLDIGINDVVLQAGQEMFAIVKNQTGTDFTDGQVIRYDGAVGGPEGVAIGETAKALAWLAVAIGGNAYAGTTSATAIGSGATSLKTHGTAIGRGAFIPNPDTVGFSVGTVLGGDLAHNLYIANTWGHQFDLPPSGISISSYATPSTNETSIHGHDAYDARATPSSFNVDAGDFGIYAGRATGTGVSGSINLYVADGNNGQNTKDTTKKALEIRSEESATQDTYVWIRDNSTGTMKKILIKSKPVECGTKGIVGFSRLQVN